jgi:Putative DNA-binding domain
VALMHIPLERIDQSHLQALLLDGKAAEALTIEYKRDTYGANDTAKAEFLADISSFANSRGGDLLIGIEAPAGVPASFAPFPGDADAERLRFEQMARSGLEPRVSNLQTKAIPIASGGWVLVIRVPRSYSAPHRVIFKGANRFYARSSAGKYQPSVDELRAIFASAPELADRMRGFRLDRVARVTANDASVTLLDDCCLLLHVVPFSHFDLRPALSFPDVVNNPGRFPPMGMRSPINWRVNFDGFLTLSNADVSAARQRAYVQIFRNGAVEAAMSSIVRSDGHVNIQSLDFAIVQHARIYAMALHECRAEPPFAVMASVIGVKGRGMVVGFDPFGTMDGEVADRDQLHFSGVVIEDIPTGNPDCAKMLRPILDHLANVAGHASAPSFDQNGNYQLGGAISL